LPAPVPSGPWSTAAAPHSRRSNPPVSCSLPGAGLLFPFRSSWILQVCRKTSDYTICFTPSRSLVSSGKAAELLGISRLEFIQRTSDVGIPYFRFTEDEWQA